MKFYYCDHFVLPLPETHRFPMAKYALLRARLLDEGIVPPEALHVPAPATDREILAVHDDAYFQRVVSGTLDPLEIRRIGFPWSPQLVERSRRSAGGTVAACRSALASGIGGNLAGGTHHASSDRGEGFCVFNDSAIAARALQADGSVRQVAVVDCDVHQGNGTATIFRDDPTVVTLSIHGEKNFPFHKDVSDIDVALPDGTGDEPYLETLASALDRLMTFGRPDLAIYVSGADPFAGDKLGRLSLTVAGLAARDALVFETLRGLGVPVAVVMAGGYGKDVHETVTIHANTVAAATKWGEGYGSWPLPRRTNGDKQRETDDD